ncbi:MAG: HNH endonuclease signature motif containing protein, partial [Blastococcus sp.]
PTGPGLGPPPDTPGYSPGARLDAFTRARDRRCRFPGCRTRAERCDLDHTTVWPHGATSEDNLCCLCRHHHRLRHQAPGWSLRRLPDGGLEWTLPGGNTITTHPPRYGTDDPPPPGTVDDDPAPF